MLSGTGRFLLKGKGVKKWIMEQAIKSAAAAVLIRANPVAAAAATIVLDAKRLI